jgi:hypothetical protein
LLLTAACVAAAGECKHGSGPGLARPLLLLLWLTWKRLHRLLWLSAAAMWLLHINFRGMLQAQAERLGLAGLC